MESHWKDLFNTLEIELGYLERLRTNLLRQQNFLIINQPVLLKDALEEEKEILFKNFQTEQYRVQLLKKMVEATLIPSPDITLDQLIELVPEINKLKIKQLRNQIKMAAFEVDEINARNRLLLKRATQLVHEELKILTVSANKTTYHQRGELIEKQQISMVNEQV